MFIDFLDLKNKDLTQNNLSIFYGKSGSGKSTYLDFFMKQKNYKNNIFLFHKEEKIIYKKLKQRYVFIDEIVYLKQFILILRYLFDGKKLFIATHIHPIIYKIFFGLFYKNSYYFTDKNNKKLEIILKERGYKFSKKTINKFIQRYGGNFIDLNIILNFYNDKKNFDEIFYLFEKECCVEYKNNY